MTRSDALFRSVFVCVVAVHSLFLLLCCYSPFASAKRSAPTRAQSKLSVQTVNLSPQIVSAEASKISEVSAMGNATMLTVEPKPLPQPVASPLPTPPSPPPAIQPAAKAPPPKASSPPKVPAKVAPKAIPKPKPEIKPAPKAAVAPIAQADSTPKQPSQATPAKQSKPENNAARQELLKKAKESINKIQNATSQNAQSPGGQVSLGAPKVLGGLQSDAFASSGNVSGKSQPATYHEELMHRLRSQLHMPEYGNVDIELTLSRSGKVLSFKILRDENRNNRQYIEKAIPPLSFPPFGHYFNGETQHAFVITLSNDL